MKYMKSYKIIFIMVVSLLLFTLSAAYGELKNSTTSVSDGLTDVDEKLQRAVSDAIKNQGNGYYNGEYLTEGHIILDVEEKDGQTKVYTLASVGWFGFENGTFTIISGSGAIATVLTFFKNEDGEYSLLEYKEPTDGIGNSASKKKMFPMKLWGIVLNDFESYGNLKKQQETQAENYLKGIGRKATVTADHVEKKLADIDVRASNRLVTLKGKDPFLNNCPYWLGTKERIEHGNRYTYETIQSQTSDGCDLIIYRKMAEDGRIIEQRKYKIAGSEPQLID